jgi:hypothetical protein
MPSRSHPAIHPALESYPRESLSTFDRRDSGLAIVHDYPHVGSVRLGQSLYESLKARDEERSSKLEQLLEMTTLFGGERPLRPAGLAVEDADSYPDFGTTQSAFVEFAVVL